MQASLKERLRKQKEAAEYLRWMTGLRGKAAVKIYDKVLNPKD